MLDYQRVFHYAALILSVSVLTVQADHPVSSDAAPTGMQYRYEAPAIGFIDVVTMKDGTKHVGKIMEWADEIHIFNRVGNVTRVPAEDAESFLFRRKDRSVAAPELPDLTVQYVERLPRETSYRGLVKADGTVASNAAQPKRHAAGEQLTLRIHVANCGLADSRSVPLTVFADDAEVGSAQLPIIAAGEAHVIDVKWSYDPTVKMLRVHIDPADTEADVTRWNNYFDEPVRALSVLVRIDSSIATLAAEGFGLTGTHSVADFANYQLRCLNALFEASKYDDAPNGILERVRCDMLEVVDSDAPPPAAGQYDAVLELMLPNDDSSGSNGSSNSSRSSATAYPVRVDWSALRNLAGQLGLVDPSPLSTHVSQSRVFDRFGRPALIAHELDDEFLGFMNVAGAAKFSRLSTAYLNDVRGKARGAMGSYLHRIPGNVEIEVLDRDGQPLAGVEIGVFQLQDEGNGARKIVGAGGASPLIEAVTDDAGRLRLPNRPVPAGVTADGISVKANAFGPIRNDYSNGLLAFRLRYGGKESFRFIALTDCQRAYQDGMVELWTAIFRTPFCAPQPAPPYVVPLAAAESDRNKQLLIWPYPAGQNPKDVMEFHVFERRGYDGDADSSWKLKAISMPGENPSRGIVETASVVSDVESSQRSDDVFVAVSMVKKDGTVSPLSEPGFLSSASSARSLAIWSDTAFVSLAHDGPVRMMYWDAVAGTQPYMPINDIEPGYDAHFAGLAFLDESLIACDPVNNCLAIYDVSRERHALQRVIPNMSDWPGSPGFLLGTFSNPQDVAVDDEGRIYVADTGNHRVQILDAQGKPLDVVDSDFRFRAPRSVCYSYGYLCITDDDGRRVRVYTVDGGTVEFKLELPELHKADRAIVNKGGQILVCAALAADSDRALMSFAPEGNTAKFLETVGRSDLGAIVRPVGLSQHGKEKFQAYFVNDFPFGVRRVQIGPQP